MTTVHRRFIDTLGIGCLLLLSSTVAVAQTAEERAGARAAARKGIEAYEAGNFAEALDLFSRAEKLVHAPTHVLYIARSNVKLNRLVAAQEAYQQLSRESLAANAPQPFRDAQQSGSRELSGLEARIPMVTVSVSGAKSDPVTVTMDGRAIPSALVGIPHPVDPGSHQFQATAPGAASPKAEKTVREGEQLSVELVLRPTGAAVPTSVTKAPAATSTAGADGKAYPRAESVNLDSSKPEAKASYRTLAYVSLGVGAVGLAAGAYFLVNYFDNGRKADDLFHRCDATSTCVTSGADKRIESFDDKAQLNGIGSGVAFSLGGLALATGITLLVIEPSGKPETASKTQPRLSGWVGPSSLGVRGQF